MAAICLLASVLTAACAAAPHAGVVKPGDWSYEAVKGLANKGLVLGYNDAEFLGNRSLTRYEMASVISRIIDRVEIAQAGDDSEIEDLPDTTAETTAAPVVKPSSNIDVSSTDLATLRKLVEEYKVELTVIGTDLQAIKCRLDTVQSDVDTIKETLNEPEGPFQTALNDISALKKVKLTGYVQARYQASQTAANGNNGNTFQVRRARIKLTATPTRRSELVIQPDFTQTVTLKEAYAGYVLGESPTLAPTWRLGQVVWPFGYENPISSALLDTPERSTVITTLFPGEYDMGTTLSSRTAGPLTWQAGFFNGTGANTLDNNKPKDFVGRLRWAATKSFNIGTSVYLGRQFNPAIAATSTLAAVPASTSDKTRYGADFQYYLPNITFKGEYVAGKQYQFARGTLPAASVTGTPNVNGAYLLSAININRSLVGVVKYSYYNPNFAQDPNGTTTSWDIGLNKYLDDKTKVRLYYQINGEQRNSFANNILRAELLTVF